MRKTRMPGLIGPAMMGLAAFVGLTAVATGAAAQPPPRGSYMSQCTDIRMNGQFLSATCRGARGGGQSSINVASCATDIGVDASGALSCGGAGAAIAPPPGPGPGYPGGPGHGGGGRPPYPGNGGGGYRPPGGGYGGGITLYSERNFRGRPVQVEGAAANLAGYGINDRVRSIRLDRRSGPWMACADANYKGRCTTVTSDVADTRRIGMGDAISSLRPAR
jgi:hypothetical protein